MRASVDVSDIQSQNPERRFQKWIPLTTTLAPHDLLRTGAECVLMLEITGRCQGDLETNRTRGRTKQNCVYCWGLSVWEQWCVVHFTIIILAFFFFFFFTPRKDDLCVFNLLKFIRVIYCVQIIIWIAICKRNLWVKIKRPWAVNYSFFRYYCYHYWRVESLCIWLTE